MKKTYYNQVKIKVQGRDESAEEFTKRLNEWLRNHKHNPYLSNATTASDGRQTLNFTYIIQVDD